MPTCKQCGKYGPYGFYGDDKLYDCENCLDPHCWQCYGNITDADEGLGCCPSCGTDENSVY